MVFKRMLGLIFALALLKDFGSFMTNGKGFFDED